MHLIELFGKILGKMEGTLVCDCLSDKSQIILEGST